MAWREGCPVTLREGYSCLGKGAIKAGDFASFTMLTLPVEADESFRGKPNLYHADYPP